jgi:hypothetical protein
MSEKIVIARGHQVVLEFGGLRLEVYYTPNFGDSTRVKGMVDGQWKELLRFDDFVDTPHYHAPADNVLQIDLDPEEIGEPAEFYLNILDNRLPEILPSIGFEAVLETLDLDEIRRHLRVVRAAMDSVLVTGFYRQPGQSLRDADPGRPQLRDEANARFAARMRDLQNS